jgi:hypothetical protein
MNIGLALILWAALPAVTWAGAKNVAVVGGDAWCPFLEAHGHSCAGIPSEGPTEPLDDYDVLIHAGMWSDPGGILADFMRAEKTVILFHHAPIHLGLNSNPTVQAWVGANVAGTSGNGVVTVATDPILGDAPVGTFVTQCGGFPCGSLDDTTGHPHAKVLARLGDGADEIAIMRNVWEGGISVFLSGITPGADPLHDEIFLNAVRVRQLVPTVGEWGLLMMGLGLASVGSILLRRRKRAGISIITVVLLTHLAPPLHV